MFLLALLFACTGPDTQVAKQETDDDDDGYTADVDCDDAHATVNPDGVEVCDGLDNDCDGTVDDGASDASPWYQDDDEDGFGDPASEVSACEAPAGMIADGTDCDDQQATVNPAGTEVCDGLDNDCDGTADDNVADPPTWYADADGDGYGDADVATTACDAPADYVASADDCDDARGDIHPDAPEDDCTDPTDYNCDGSTQYTDADGDGYAACEDCDDGDEARSPGLPEVCGGGDEDCDDLTDDDDPSVTGTTAWYRDVDADGYASGSGSPVEQCEAPTGYASDTGDCDDYDSTVNPGASEVCDAYDVDEDCDGLTDDADPSTDAASWNTWYADRDGDAYGDPSRSVQLCEAPSGYVASGTDCDDTTAARNPGEAEVCDAADVDEDCDGLADSADPGVTGGSTWYTDADRDGYGGSSSTVACEAPSGAVATGGDCDDTSTSVHPGATEVCDAANVDEDCDGAADDVDTTASGKSTWFRDADGDGYGGSSTTSACDQPVGYYATSTDCNDGNLSINPGAAEVCDAADLDEDCDGLVDDADGSVSGRTTWYRDADGDGYAGSGTTQACSQPAGYYSSTTDCDDSTASVRPGGSEVCDAANADEDCDGTADDADTSATGKGTLYRDADGDGYGNPSVTTTACDGATGYVSNASDCDDTDGSVGSYRTWYRDNDGDGYGSSTTTASCTQPSGYVATTGDCSDSNAAVSPAATEVCDGSNVDEDCDGVADDTDTYASGKSTWYRDADTDGYGTTTTSTTACDQPSGYVSNSTDCNDGNAAVSPADPEVCDGSNVDEDCDGAADDSDTGGATGKSTWYVDADADGYGVAAGSVSRCDTPSGYATVATDCDDAHADAYPGGTEVCDDGIDQDCSGADETCSTPGYSGDYAVDTGYDSKIYGGYSGDYFGYAMVAGDFDGDGAGDLVVNNRYGEWSSYTNYGTVFGYLGPFAPGVERCDVSPAWDYYNTSSSYAGSYGNILANIGDMNGDGRDDLYVSLNSGTGYVYYGGDSGATSYSTNDDLTTGCTSAARAGDFNATSVTDDWVCGLTSYSSNKGEAIVYYGNTTVATLPGEASSDYAGNSVAGGQDVDGDGYDDLLVGAPYNDASASDGGAAYLVYAPVSGTFNLSGADARIKGPVGSDLFGWTVLSPGDLDGDGYADLVATAIGADESATGAGSVYVFLDVTSGEYTATTSANAVIRGEDAADAIGDAVDMGDVDGDGALDLLFGSYNNDNGGANAGSAWLLYGPFSGTYRLGTDHDARWTGDNASDSLGWAVAVVPDTDGDGDDEIALSGPIGDERGYTDHGAVWIWAGQ